MKYNDGVKRALMCFAVILFFMNAGAQNKKPDAKHVQSKVVDMLSGKPLAGVTVELYKNGSLVETQTTSSSGKYKFNSTLPLDNTFKIVFKSSGYVPRFLEVDLRNIPPEDVYQKGWEVPFDMSLAERLPDLDFSPVENKITSTLKYSKSTGQLEFDLGEKKAYDKEMEKILKKAEQAKKDQEKKEQELEQKYTAAMAAAETALKKDDYPTAIAKYNEALGYKKDDLTAKTKLADAETKKAEYDKKQLAEKEYKNQYDIAEAKYKQKDYDGAIEAYRKAKEYKNDPAIDKKIKEVETARDNDAKAMKEKKFTDLVAQADKAYTAKDYGSARDLYKKAFEEKADPAIQKKITDVENLMKKQIEDEQKYEQFMADGNKASLNEKWGDAIAAYEKALAVRSESKDAQDGLNKAKAAKVKADQELANKAKTDADFAAAVKLGDAAIAAKKYDEAITAYDKALGIKQDAGAQKKKDDAVAAKKLAEEAALAAKEKEKIEADYKQALADGDKANAAKDYDNAISNYEKALSLKAGDKTATDKLNAAKKSKDDLAEGQRKEKEYNDLKTAGDEAFKNEKYDEAVQKYTKAKEYKADPYLDAQIAKAQKAIADNKAQEGKKKEFQAALTQGDQELSTKEYDKAIATYQKALAMKIDDASANAKIDDARKQKADWEAEQKDKAAKEKLEAEFLALVKKGDDELAKKSYAGAITAYEAALAKKDDSGVRTKLANAQKQKEDAEKAMADAAQREAKYKEHIASGDAALKSKDIDNAINEYQAALDLKNGDKVAGDKLAAAQKIKADEQKKQLDYENFMAQGQKELDVQKFDEAIKSYTAALGVKANDPGALAKIEEVKKSKEDWLKNKDLEAQKLANKKKYEDAIKKGDAQASEGKFDEAIAFYNDALVAIPDDAVAKARIADANDRKNKRENELKEQFAKILQQADTDFEKENYADAKGYYERYLKFDKTSTHASDRVKLCDQKIKEKELADAAYQKKKADFDVMIKKGDAELAQKKYDAAIAAYNAALGIIPDEPTAVQKIKDVEKIKDELANADLNKKYADAINKGDVEASAGKFDEAIDYFNKALDVKPGDAVAQARIADAKAKKEKRARELEDQFAKIMAQADSDFSKENYADAKDYYQRYLKFDKDNTHASERIKECDAKIREKELADAAYAKKRSAFEAEIAKGDALVKQKKYDAAIISYNAALGIIPDEPSALEKLKNVQQLKDDIANADINKKYTDAINKGDSEASTGKFDEAITYYTRALDVKPGDALAEARIADAKAKKEKRARELEDQFAKILAQADKDFDKGNYEDAIGYYERYLGFNKGHSHSVERIAEAKKLMAANADAAAKKKKYEELILAGDRLVKDRQYDDAITSYTNAMVYMPDDPVALDKIAKARQLKIDMINAAKNKAQEKENEAKYREAFNAGMDANNASDWKKAISRFKEALDYKPGDKPATDMLEKARKRLKDKEAEGDAMYQKIITVADQRFDEENYKDALDLYKRANNFRPSDPYPKERIAECENRIRMASREHVSIGPENGELVTNQTVDDALKLIQEAKRQEKFDAEHKYVEQNEKRDSLNGAYLGRSDDYRFNNKSTLDKKQADLDELKANDKMRIENTEQFIGVLDGQANYYREQGEQNAKNGYDQQKQFEQLQQSRSDLFVGQDVYRQYLVDSTYEYIDKRDAAYRGKIKDQTLENYNKQKGFEQYEFDQTSMFKDMDKTYRGYKVDSLYHYKDNRDEAYRAALKDNSQKTFDTQKGYEQDEFNRSQLYIHKDQELRGYMVDSVHYTKDVLEQSYRDASKNNNEQVYSAQHRFETEEDNRTEMFKGMDQYRKYNVDSMYYYKNNRDETYRAALKDNSAKTYDTQKGYEQDEFNRSELYKNKDAELRGYMIDSVHYTKDNMEQSYRDASKSNAEYVYATQKNFNDESFNRDRQFESKDEIRQESIRETNNTVNEANSFLASNRDKQENFVDLKHTQFKNDADARYIKDHEDEKNYLENSKELIAVNDERTKKNESLNATSDEQRMANNEKFKKLGLVEPKNYDTGYLSTLAQDLGPGIHQWTYNSKDDKGRVSEVIIRRVVVKGNTANVYKMAITKWGQNYFKNGQPSNEHTWNVETGGTVVEHATE